MRAPREGDKSRFAPSAPLYASRARWRRGRTELNLGLARQVPERVCRAKAAGAWRRSTVRSRRCGARDGNDPQHCRCSSIPPRRGGIPLAASRRSPFWGIGAGSAVHDFAGAEMPWLGNAAMEWPVAGTGINANEPLMSSEQEPRLIVETSVGLTISHSIILARAGELWASKNLPSRTKWASTLPAS
jgi:hypothetical protein